jgi:rhamnogalacturonyl hydrolase YesR
VSTNRNAASSPAIPFPSEPNRRRFLQLLGSAGTLCLAAPAAAARKSRFLWSTRVADTFLARFPDPDVIHWRSNANHFSWQAGYTMFTMEKLWRSTGDRRYFEYIRRYVDQQVDEQGRIPGFIPNALDNFIPGYAILFLYEQTHLEKYKTAAATIRNAFAQYPRNSDGSFWHSEWAKQQMWVDGVFMGEIFAARYGAVFNDAACFDQVAQQMKLVLGHCRKPNGLLLHGWNETRTASWADPQTGLAREVWSEGLGWFACLIADVFDFLPKNHPDRSALLGALRDLCAGLRQVQDEKTGMWCQVVDKPHEPGNWNESSGTGMFTYLIRKSIQKGYIPRNEYMPVVRRAYAGLVTKAVPAADGRTDIVDCSSIGIQDNYQAYIHCPHETNTFAGVTSFILGTGIMEADPHRA